MKIIIFNVMAYFVALWLVLCSFPVYSSTTEAKYAQLNYDVVYVRCPRATENVKWLGETLLNWNGANDAWLSATNNIYQQPGCDLVLHHSSPEYGGGLPLGDRGREEVLVNCDESDNTKPICTIADPNVSLDGKVIVFTKILDTRNFVTDVGIITGYPYGHSQSYLRLFPDGNSTDPYAGKWAKRVQREVPVFDSPALIFKYDLSTGVETQVSPHDDFFRGRAIAGKDQEWEANVPVTDNGAAFISENTLVFTSNRDSVLQKFKLFKMNIDGSNLELVGHRAMSLQLHPFVLKSGRVAYTNFDAMIQKVGNNQFSLFSVRPDGGDPFILAGKHDPSFVSLHFATQLSDGDIVSTMYYNRNNRGLGGLLRFPIDPDGPDFEHREYNENDGWRPGGELEPFARVGQYDLTPFAPKGDVAAVKYNSADDYWLHPSRNEEGESITIGGQSLFVNKSLITMSGKFSHPAAAPDNGLIATYAIGAATTMQGAYAYDTLEEVIERIGKDAGLWFFPLQANGTEALLHIAKDGEIIVDYPEYHEIMARAVVSYEDIYGVKKPGLLTDGSVTADVSPIENLGLTDVRLSVGQPYGLTGAATLFDRETRALNGVPWSMNDGGGTMSGRTYSNLATSGADLAIYDNTEIAGIRVLLAEPLYPINNWGGLEQWGGFQQHHLRILGEYPVRKRVNGEVVYDGDGNPDTSFVIKLPANTPFLFQSIDNKGMALDIETTTRTVHRGEQQFCGGCHVHTRESLDPFLSVAKLDTTIIADFTQESAPLFDSISSEGMPLVKLARDIYEENVSPGVTTRRSFEIDWTNGISQIIDSRCSSCHAEGAPAQQLTGLRLDGDVRTYDLLKKNGYVREDGARIEAGTKPGDGLADVINNTPDTDRITRRAQCCSATRWVSFNSARSSMLVWALYGERLDGRNPSTGLPWGSRGEVVPLDKQGLAGVKTDLLGLDRPEVWPKVSEHLSYVSDMPESEKRLISRWVDLGIPKIIIHEDNLRPVLTLTPVVEDNSISKIYIGVWDDSPIDYSRFSVKRNNVEIMNGENISGKPDVIELTLPVPINSSNAQAEEYVFEIWDKPYRRLEPLEFANEANRMRRTVNGLGLLSMTGESSNHAPTHTSAVVTAESGVKTSFYAIVTDPDIGDSHLYLITKQPTNGIATVENNKLVYLADNDYLGSDAFEFRATDLRGLSVEGVATINVIPKKPMPVSTNTAPIGASIIGDTLVNTAVLLVPVVQDIDIGDNHTFTILTPPSNGEVKLVSNVIEYIPDQGFLGMDSFSFSAVDQGGLSVDGIANILVKAPSSLLNPPTEAFASIVTFVDEAVTFSPTVNDPDVDDVHKFELINQPRNGSAQVVNNQFMYTPKAHFLGFDSFMFRVLDQEGLSVNGYANIRVVPKGEDLIPIYVRALFVTSTNTSVSVTPEIEGYDSASAVSYVILSPPKHGVVIVELNKLVYSPNKDYIGPDSFMFEVIGSNMLSFLGVAKVEVKDSLDVSFSNKPPTSAKAEKTGYVNQEVVMTPLVIDPDLNDTFSFKMYEAPSYGNAYVSNDQLVYLGGKDYIGKDTFTFIVEDSGGSKVVGVANVIIKDSSESKSFSASLGYVFLLFLFLAAYVGRIKN